MFEENDIPENADGDRRRTRMFFPENADAQFSLLSVSSPSGAGRLVHNYQ